MAGPAFRAAAVRVRTPATSANLGPGFDAFGLALGLYDDVVVRVADSGLHVDIAGEGADTLARDEKHLVVRALRTAFDLLARRVIANDGQGYSVRLRHRCSDDAEQRYDRLIINIP